PPLIAPRVPSTFGQRCPGDAGGGPHEVQGGPDPWPRGLPLPCGASSRPPAAPQCWGSAEGHVQEPAHVHRVHWTPWWEGAWQITMPNVTTAEQSYPQIDLQPEEIWDKEAQALLIAQLEEASTRAEALELLGLRAWAMSCSAAGTRVVQKALEVAVRARTLDGAHQPQRRDGTAAEKDTPERVALAEQLQGHVKEAFASPHANHVLQKCIQLIPPERLGFLLAEMHGSAVAAASHRYGCRVLERLLEHCPSEQTAPLIEEVLSGAPQLCRHTFGNFVVQHILEHG
ncbi:Maternal protein pumilio, partial [Durusdinium trenchii]